MKETKQVEHAKEEEIKKVKQEKEKGKQQDLAGASKEKVVVKKNK